MIVTARKRTYYDKRHTTSSHMAMDMVIPLFNKPPQLMTRIIVIGITCWKINTQTKEQIWDGVKYLCGTADGLYINSFDFPFRIFGPVQYEDVTNPYEAANRYVQHLASNLGDLLQRPEAVQHIKLRRVPVTQR